MFYRDIIIWGRAGTALASLALVLFIAAIWLPAFNAQVAATAGVVLFGAFLCSVVVMANE